MPRLLILKTGDKLPALNDVPGDFEHWIAQGMGLARAEWRVVAVHRGEPLPPPEQVPAVAITGSAAMVTDGSDWIRRSAAWLRQLVPGEVPVLGICFGHQLIAHALGGAVGDNPRGIEVGTVTVRHTAAEGDPVFGALPASFPAQASHRQAVLSLPPEARRLATSARDANHGFAFGARAWGVQFHPEFDARISRAYIRHYRAALSDQGDDPQAILAGCAETPFGASVLQRFAQLLPPGD